MPLEGSEEARETLTDWLRKTRNASPRASQDMTVCLHQVGMGGVRGEPIQTFELEAGEEDLEPVARDIVEYAEQTTEQIGGGYERISFTVVLEGKQKAFSLSFPDDGEDDEKRRWGGPAPIASEQGALGMFMQHEQVLVREIVNQSADNNKMLQRENMDLRRQNAELIREQLRMLGLYKEIIGEDQKLRMEAAKVESSIRMKEMALGKVMSMGVPLLNAFAGNLGLKKLPTADGEPDSPLESMLVDVVGSFRQEQIQRLATSGILDEEQLIGIMTLIQCVKEKISQASPSAEKVSAPEPQPETASP